MALLMPERALEERARGERLAVAGKLADACFSLAWAMLSLKAAGRDMEAAEAGLSLAWAQGLDGRTWQAARTLQDVISYPAFASLSRGFRARGYLLFAWALWDLGEYSLSRQQAQLSYLTSERQADRGRASLALGQVLLYFGETESAEASFAEAVQCEPTLKATAFSVKSYLHNLAGRHAKALVEAQAGLDTAHNAALENYDITNRAVERSALMVEQGTAKAFLEHPDAWDTLIEAQALLDSLPFDTQLESARVRRAMGLVLAKAGEHHAALALLEEAFRVFRRRSVRPEYDLTVRAMSRIHKKRGARGNDKAPA
ncbi:MAG: hypothetical protein Q8P31_03535 [Bacillota bacterium]|nr:hypothetical protein [Bacillota bacterium]